MKIEITFTRGSRCAHSDIRQCAPCWKREMTLFLGESEETFEHAWRRRIASDCDDEIPESYSLYELSGYDRPDDPEDKTPTTSKARSR